LTNVFATNSHYLGVDLGQVRVGLAIADAALRLALPLGVVAAQPADRLGERIRQATAGHRLLALVVGLPLDSAGRRGPQAQAAEQAAHTLAQALELPLHLVDERYTTRAVQSAPGRRGPRTSAAPDAQAATLILQSFLDAGGN
jgi:putative Holliday junction resolvase